MKWELTFSWAVDINDANNKKRYLTVAELAISIILAAERSPFLVLCGYGIRADFTSSHCRENIQCQKLAAIIQAIHELIFFNQTHDFMHNNYHILPIKRTVRVEVGKTFWSRGVGDLPFYRTTQWLPIGEYWPLLHLCALTVQLA